MKTSWYCPKSEQIPKDRYRKGDTVRAVVHRVEIINGTPKIILSRAAPAFLERLFEQEVPEIYRWPHHHQEYCARTRRAGQSSRRKLR